MKSKLISYTLAIATILGLCLVNAHAQPAKDAGFNYKASGYYSGSAGIKAGTVDLGDVSAANYSVSGNYAMPVGEDGLFRIGGTFDTTTFSRDAAFIIPGELYSLALNLGYSAPFSDAWSYRIDISPGIYSDFNDISKDDLNVPSVFSVIYTSSPDLQWYFAVIANPRGKTPVMGGVGVRWRFAEQWTLNLLFPNPQIEYAASDSVTLFAGASMQGGTYNLADNFGTPAGRPGLNNEYVDYREICVGTGAKFTLSPDFTATVGAGWMVDRRFEYDADDLTLNGDGSFYIRASVGGRF
ncbi:MAG: DUF6268 family outer membrane beta-barrel protein [Verrucomicrobiota bacterium]|nr:DUF6268 family outer membrane beta-barrel protein [Verrucomicrobiota bacterium]